MRGRRAKALRRVARAISVGAPAVKYNVIERVPAQVRSADGRILFKSRDQVVLAPHCLRYRYLELKKMEGKYTCTPT